MVTAAPGAGGGPAFALSHAGERQGAGRGEAAGNEAGAAEEGAAIETAIRLAGESGEIHASRVTFRSLDQQGRLPQLGYRLTR
jgi:hypothetical protein